jgi:hypothetical protein
LSSRRSRPVLVEAANEAVGDGGEQLPVVANSAVGGALTVPTDEQMSLALANANDGESLKSLHDVVAALQKTAEQFKVAADEIGRIAVSRLFIERKLGAHLAQTVRRGGRGSKSTRLISIRGGSSAGLPPGVTPQMAAKYRELAGIPESVFAAYLDRTNAEGRVPSANGARRFATKGAGEAPKVRVRANRRSEVAVAQPVLTPQLLDLVQRVLGDIDVCVGEAKVKCRLRVSASTVTSKQLRGNIFVAECLDPAEWLPKLAKLRREAAVDQVIVVLPAETWAPWFSAFAGDDWGWCFVRGAQPPVMLAHLGRSRGFAVAFSQTGVLSRVVIC